MLRSSELQVAAECRIGECLRDKWRLDALLGLGGTAAVYAATHRNGSRVAIKILHRHLSAFGHQMRRFLREAYAANLVGHPGAVAVYDDDVQGDDAFLVMELLEGVNLKDHAEANGGRLSVAETLKLADELLDVLKEAHARGIVHRDIKPSNLFLSRSGVLKVLDFGVARAGIPPADAQSTLDGDVIGTPAFMAPEQARAQNREVDARADVWSVGATLFTLLSGELVHPASTASEHLCLTMSASARSFASVRPDLPAALAAVIDRCLRHDPAQRWPSAEALQDALRTLDPAVKSVAARSLSDSDLSSVSTATLSVTTASLRQRSRSRRLFAGVVVGLCIAAGLVVLTTMAHDQSPAHRVASLELTSQPAHPSLATVKEPPATRRTPALVSATPLKEPAAPGKKAVQRRRQHAEAARTRQQSGSGEKRPSSNPLDWRN